MAKRIDAQDIVGRRFGYWTVVRYLGTTKVGKHNRYIRRWYECECRLCGSHYIVRRDSLLGYSTFMCSHCARYRVGSHLMSELPKFGLTESDVFEADTKASPEEVLV